MAERVDPALVLNCLRQAQSIDLAVRQPAETALQQAEACPGFCTSVMEIVNAREQVEEGTRWLAVITFKNLVGRFWRKSAARRVSEEEKAAVRQQMLATLLTEPHPKIALQVALLFSKIARIDVPTAWPELLPFLLESVQATDPLRCHRSLLVLYHVLKELASKRLVGGRNQFAELAPKMFQFCLDTWKSQSEALLSQTQQGQFDSAAASSALTLLFLKVLRKLVTFGYKKILDSPHPAMFLEMGLHRLDAFLAVRLTIPEGNPLREHIEKMINVIGKVVIELQYDQPLSFAQFLKPALAHYINAIIHAHDNPPLYGRYAIQALRFVGNVVKCTAYRPRKAPEDPAVVQTPDPEAALHALACSTLQQCFTPDLFKSLVHALILQFFKLTEADLNEWNTDPENYVVEQETDDVVTQPRAAAESLYMSIISGHREVIAPMVMELLQQVCATPVSQLQLNDILVRDAVYAAMGFGGYDLYDYVKFEEWYATGLVNELQESFANPNLRVLRRRIVWLVSYWIDQTANFRPTLYDVLSKLLSDEDLIIRLSSALTLHALVDDFQFFAEQFSPYAEGILSALFTLTDACALTETKLQVLKLIAVILERMGQHLVPLMPRIVQFLPQLWQQAQVDDESMLKASLVQAFKNVVQALGSESHSVYNVIIPVIKFSTDISQAEELYLMEDGLELWLTVIRQAGSINEPLMHLFPNITNLILRDFEHLKAALRIVEGYVLLAGPLLVQTYQDQLAAIFNAAVGNVSDRGTYCIVGTLDTIIQCCPAEIPGFLPSTLQKLLTTVLDPASTESDLIVCQYYAVFGRVLIHNKDYFLSFFEAMEQLSTSGPLLGPFVEKWIRKVDNMALVVKRKLAAMAMTMLMSLPRADVAALVPQILKASLQVHVECEGNTEDGQEYLLLGEPDEDGYYDDGNATEGSRKRQLYQRDPVNAIKMNQAVKEKMNEMRASYPADQLQQVFALVDPAVLQQLQSFGVV